MGASEGFQAGEWLPSFRPLEQKYHGLNDLNIHFFLSVLEAGKSEIRVRVDPVSGESQLPSLQTVF